MAPSSLFFRWVLSLLLLGVALIHVAQRLYADSLHGWLDHTPQIAADTLRDSPSLLTWPTSEAAIQISWSTDPAGITAAHLRYLALNPGDAAAWNRLAVDLYLKQQLDSLMANAVERALALAPHSRPIAITQSIIAAYNWDQSPERLKRIWLDAFETAALSRNHLIHNANKAGVMSKLCSIMPPTSRPDEYCKILPAMTKLCLRPSLSPRQVKYCVNTGLMER